MVRDYELLYIVRPELDEDGVRAAMRSVRGIVEQRGGQVVKTTLWGRRRLAYDVGRLRDGHYVLLLLRLDGAKVAEVERALRIHDTVFRHLLVLHEGAMPEPDGDAEEPALEPGPPEPEPVAVAADVAAPSAATEEDGAEEGFTEAPAATDEGDE